MTTNTEAQKGGAPMDQPVQDGQTPNDPMDIDPQNGLVQQPNDPMDIDPQNGLEQRGQDGLHQPHNDNPLLVLQAAQNGRGAGNDLDPRQVGGGLKKKKKVKKSKTKKKSNKSKKAKKSKKKKTVKKTKTKKNNN